jgi:hypothetical protein
MIHWMFSHRLLRDTPITAMMFSNNLFLGIVLSNLLEKKNEKEMASAIEEFRHQLVTR